jgi:uncharacterized protein
VIFGLMVSLLFALMHLYLWKRLVKDTTRPGRARLVGTVVIIALGVLVMATLVLGRVLGPDRSAWFAWPGYVWFGLAAYLFLCTVVLELPRLAFRGWVRRRPLEATATSAPPVVAEDTEEPLGKPEVNQSRRLFLARTTGVVAGVAAAGLTGSGMVSALGPPDLLRYRVPIRRLHTDLAGLRIAVVSDIHLGPLLGASHTERIVRMINEAEPDLVAIVGDLADGTVGELGDAAAPLRDLVADSYFVTGNHEYFTEPEPWLRELERLDVRPLRNERVDVTRGSGVLDLAGVNDLGGRSSGDGPDFRRALGDRDADRPVVLLAHQPVQVHDAARYDVDLQLSGHTHGGQLFPFQYVVGAQQPAVAGLSTVDGTQLYVTRGAGFWGPPVRVGAPPDITMIELTPRDA